MLIDAVGSGSVGVRARACRLPCPGCVCMCVVWKCCQNNLHSLCCGWVAMSISYLNAAKTVILALARNNEKIAVSHVVKWKQVA